MFNTYARICIDESDEEEPSASRVIRETAAPAVPALPATVVTRTGATSGRTQQAVLQRRGGSSNSLGHEYRPWTEATTSSPANMGNLIDLGDDPEPRPRSAAPSRSRGRQHVPSPPTVELVTLSQNVDPFFDFAQSRSTATAPVTLQQQQQPGRWEAAGPSSDVRHPQHPLDFLYGGEPAAAGREAMNDAASTSGEASRPAAFPNFGSFSDLLRGLTPSPATAATGGGSKGASGSSTFWDSFSGAAAAAAAAPSSSLTRHHGLSQSTNGIDDLLMQQRAMREGVIEAAGEGARPFPAPASAASPALRYKAPGVMQTDRNGPDVFDPFQEFTPNPSSAGPIAAAAASDTASSTAASTAAAGGPGPQSRCASTSTGSAPPVAAEARDDSFVIGSGGGEGFSMNQRELLLYAIPLLKDRLVFLPVVNWKDAEDTSTVLGKVSAGVSNVQQNLSNMWHSLKDKGNFSAKIYNAGQAILENMNAEERLMKNIPRKANKLVVHHPATVPPDEIQDQLTQLTANFCYKSVGKAAVAGVMLPVAVGLEVLAVPGIGWYTAYQLFKSTSAVAGGSRLNNYLKSEKSDVRVCYAPCTKMDLYSLKARLSPDGILGSEDIEDLCHDIRQPTLLHPLTELRNRYLRKTQTTKADYALLPMSAPDVDEQYGSGPKKKE
ncbi:hypothetical protein VaNZ11_015490 [Volvox africanus]|uniref:Uncharacterized protein n=1 Tax=Volvox africanus TaxID=51714 RepID=A0ABQ5SME4_9CHLO|nr:hypothetical protein VaNZ11_015490 [Volvox africanus]